MKSISFYIISCLFLFVGCVEKMDIEVEGHSELIVIDAMVTDFDTVQTVFIRRERESLEYFQKDKYPPFENASVHIEDDNGWSGDFEDAGKGREFTLKGHQFEPGRTYTITVCVDNRFFTAAEKMMPPPDIEGMMFYSSQTKDGEENWNPILHFKDNQPDVDNYYLFTGGLEWIRNGSPSRYVEIQLLSDVGLRDDMDGIALSLGMGAEWYMSTLLHFGDYYYYNLLTISKSNYDYYSVMQEQIESDGGVYKPSPTSPITNFSGKDVQGQFVAASRVQLTGRVWIDNIRD